jgi:hypothetical protein
MSLCADVLREHGQEATAAAFAAHLRAAAAQAGEKSTREGDATHPHAVRAERMRGYVQCVRAGRRARSDQAGGTT